MIMIFFKGIFFLKYEDKKNKETPAKFGILDDLLDHFGNAKKILNVPAINMK